VPKSVERHSSSAWAWMSVADADVEDAVPAWEDLVGAVNERLQSGLRRLSRSDFTRPAILLLRILGKGTLSGSSTLKCASLHSASWLLAVCSYPRETNW
jgi:hypothetical protein